MTRPAAAAPVTPLSPAEILRMAGVNGPPGASPQPHHEEAVDPSELWQALSSIPRPWKLVDVPRKMPGTGQPVGQVAMWPLTQEEQMAANAEADRFTKRLMQDPQRKEEANLGYTHTFSNEVALQVLWRAARDPKDLKRAAFPSPSLMRSAFSTDEIGVLFNSYCTVQVELGPIIAHMTTEEIEAMVLRLYEGGSMYPFDYLAWEQQRTLVAFLVSQVVSFWMVTTSAGGQPGVGFTTKQAIADLLARATAVAPADILAGIEPGATTDIEPEPPAPPPTP